jgi:hypothetical protein
MWSKRRRDARRSLVSGQSAWKPVFSGASLQCTYFVSFYSFNSSIGFRGARHVVFINSGLEVNHIFRHCPVFWRQFFSDPSEALKGLSPLSLFKRYLRIFAGKARESNV